MKGLTSEEEKIVELAVQALEITEKFRKEWEQYNRLIRFMPPEKQARIISYMNERLGYSPLSNTNTMVV